ncbi:MAG: ACP phosphodiesterase [Candidatus Thiodiazotropha sp.]
MNWLAHIFLSEDDIAYQHGNLLADMLKGRSWEGASPQFDAGLSMHRAIDSFTDSHPLVNNSISRLCDSGYLKRVVIDITYDHLLAKHWQRFANLSLEQFIEAFHERSSVEMASYPQRARHFIFRLIQSGHLLDYQSITVLDKAFRRIEMRLSARVLAKEHMLDYLPIVKRELSKIEQDFLDFMPELINHFTSQAKLISGNHWLKQINSDCL